MRRATLATLTAILVLSAAAVPGHAQEATPEQVNRALAQRWIDEIWNAHDPARVDDLMAADFTFNWAPPGMPADRDGYRALLTHDFETFADGRYTVEQMIAEGDRVVVRWISHSVHRGEYLGVAGTGKTVTVSGLSVLQIRDGRIRSETTEMDLLGLAHQIGVLR